MKGWAIAMGFFFLLFGFSFSICGFPLGLILIAYGVLAPEREVEQP